MKELSYFLATQKNTPQIDEWVHKAEKSLELRYYDTVYRCLDKAFHLTQEKSPFLFTGRAPALGCLLERDSIPAK